MSAYSLFSESNALFSAMKAQQNRTTKEIMPVTEAATPDAGAYINEADFQQMDWQNVYFGCNYDKLLAVKKKYDSKGVFYNPIAVDSER